MSGPRQYRQARKRTAGTRRAKFKNAQLLPFKVDTVAGEVVLPIIIESEANGREHWAAKAKRAKAHRKEALSIPRSILQAPPCIVTLTRISPRGLDGDNLQSGFKALRDGIADRLGIDDKDPRVEWRYQHEKGEPNQYGARVRIEPAEAA